MLDDDPTHQSTGHLHRYPRASVSALRRLLWRILMRPVRGPHWENLHVLRRELRAEWLRPVVFRQHWESFGSWVDSELDKQMARDLE